MSSTPKAVNLTCSSLAVAPVSTELYKTLLPILEAAGLDTVLSITELSGGLSNHNYKIITPKASYVLRVNANATDIFCIREQERFYWQQLARAKVAPQLFWVSDDERYYLSEFIASDGIQDDPISEPATLFWRDLENHCARVIFCRMLSAIIPKAQQYRTMGKRIFYYWNYCSSYAIFLRVLMLSV